MSREATQESEHGGVPTRGEEALSGASDFEDSVLGELRQSEPLLPLPGEVLGGPDGRRYEVLEWMGGGGMGQVFRARDGTLRREVALKFLLPRPGCEAEALAEARAVARLDQENIVRIFDVAEWSGIPEEPGVPFLVMECLEGESLSALLKRGRLEVRRALEVLEGICVGLAHAHERGLLHRDLKPGNVFLTREGTVKLLDFGLSHLMVASTGLEPHLAMAGTPAYMAPEQWRGEAQDARTDLWAAGVVLYEMLTGGLPFAGATMAELRERVLSEQPVPPVRARNPEVPREVEVLLATALAKDPARRFRTALELREELHEVAARLWPGGGAPKQTTPQRRQMTLVALELAGLAGSGAPLEAEEVGELETAFHEACVEVIERHGGSISLSMGGEVLACFGWTQGREDDSERAVRAGLRLTGELRDSLQRRLPHLPLSGLAVRGGVHTELMVVGPRLQGDAPKVAWWLARRAGPGGLVVSDSTWRLVRGSFLKEPLGSGTFEGLSGRVSLAAHRVLREREVASRFERARVARRLSPLVGRERELKRLLAHWARARRGRGGFVLVRGEAGIGKSRLIQALCEQVARSATLIRAQCWSRFSTHAPHPILEMVQAAVGLRPEDSPSLRLEKLEERVRTLGLPPERTHLLALMLELPAPENSPVLQLTFEQRKQMAFETLASLLVRRPPQAPSRLLVIEDLHWADFPLLELLGFFLECVGTARCLVVLSARPEFQPDWPRRAGFHRLELKRLPAGRSAALVRQMARGCELPEETVQELVGKTDGIPLFIEEMTRRVLEGGSPASIPLSLHELLLAKLDLLPSRQKSLAQLGAVLGRDFAYELLAAVAERDDACLRRELAGLVEAGLLRQRPGTRGDAYEFRHALLQEAAYQSLSRSARRRQHERIARVLPERFPGLVERRPEVLAYHLTEAGEHAPAIEHWTRAGQIILEDGLCPEALGFLTRALELLPALPEGEPRLHAELRIRMLLCMALAHERGFFAPEVERMSARIQELIPLVGEALPRLELPWWEVFSKHYVRSEFQQGYSLAERLVDLGRRHGHRDLAAMGYRVMATHLSSWGRLREALAHLERALEYSDFTLEERQRIAARTWGEPRTTALAYGSIVQALLGRMEESRRWGQQALALAGRVGHPHTTAFALFYTATACFMRGEALEVSRLAEQSLALSRERGFKLWHLLASVFRGWAVSELGNPREGCALMAPQIDFWRETGFCSAGPGVLYVFARGLLKLGQGREALAAVEEALHLSAVTEEHLIDSELHRQRGECLWRLGRPREAKECFLRALAMAREQGAALFELRATVSLGQLLVERGRPRVARRLLERACHPLEGGGEWADLQEARALLASLRSSHFPPAHSLSSWGRGS